MTALWAGAGTGAAAAARGAAAGARAARSGAAARGGDGQAACGGSCAVGPCLLLGRDALKSDASIKLTITRAGKVVFDDSTVLTQLKRSFEELVEFLYRELDFPNGAMLMTGTGLVPGSDFTLSPGDVVAIEIEGLGVLENVVA